MKQTKRLVLALFVVALMASMNSMVLAKAPEAGSFAAGIYGGQYKPGPDILDDQGTFGIRFGWMYTKHVGFSASLGSIKWESDDDEVKRLLEKEFPGANLNASNVRADVDVDILLIDVNAWYVFKPEKRFSFTVGGGIGVTSASADGEIRGPNGTLFFQDITDSSLTANIAVGSIIGITENFFIRLMPKARWYEGREEDAVDIESSLLLGWTFGI